jgi:hypothetical protein
VPLLPFKRFVWTVFPHPLSPASKTPLSSFAGHHIREVLPGRDPDFALNAPLIFVNSTNDFSLQKRTKIYTPNFCWISPICLTWLLVAPRGVSLQTRPFSFPNLTKSK